MRIKSKVWLEENGKPVFGEGKSKILAAIQKHRSINRAASSIGMSFRHAWSYISEIEKRTNMRLVERVKGGKGGGGSHLTDSAEELMKKYNKLKEDVDRYTDIRAKELFSEWKSIELHDSFPAGRKR